MNEDSDATRTAGDRTIQALGALFGDASPRTVFSEPVRQGEELVFTAAAWERAGGFGFGGGSEGAKGSASGSGGGGGGAAQGRPVAIVQVGRDGIRVVPVLDLTKISVTVVVAALATWRALRT